METNIIRNFKQYLKGKWNWLLHVEVRKVSDTQNFLGESQALAELRLAFKYALRNTMNVSRIHRDKNLDYKKKWAYHQFKEFIEDQKLLQTRQQNNKKESAK